MSNFMIIRPMGVELFHVDGQTYRQQTGEGKSDSSQFCGRAPKHLYDSSVATCAFIPGLMEKLRK
jgi:hypothetical protein